MHMTASIWAFSNWWMAIFVLRAKTPPHRAKNRRLCLRVALPALSRGAAVATRVFSIGEIVPEFFYFFEKALRFRRVGGRVLASEFLEQFLLFFRKVHRRF